MQVFARFTMTTNAASGFAFVAWHPNCTNNNSTNDHYFVKYSDLNYSGDTIGSTATTGVNGLNSNSPFTVADWNGEQSWRVTTCAICVQYAGTEQHRGGTYYILRQPDNQTLTGRSAATMAEYRQCEIKRVTDEPVYCRYLPVAPGHFDYSAGDNHTSFALTDYPMAIAVQSSSPLIQETFFCQVFMNVEVIGQHVPSITMSPSSNQAPQAISILSNWAQGVSSEEMIKAASSLRPIIEELWRVVNAAGPTVMMGMNWLARRQIESSLRRIEL
jgi:hypothetical protein